MCTLLISDSYFGNNEQIIIERFFVFQNNVYQWNLVFYIAAAVFFFGNLIFVIFGKGEVQWWNNVEEVQARQKKLNGDIEDYI